MEKRREIRQKNTRDRFSFLPQTQVLADNGNMHQFLHFWLTECSKTDIILPVCRVNTAFLLSTAVREERFFLRPPSSKCSGRKVSAGKIFQEVKRNGYFSHLSAQEDPALQGARLPQENVHCQRPQGSCPSSCTRPRPSHPLRAGATCVSYATDETMRDG